MEQNVFFIDFTCSGFYYTQCGNVTVAHEILLRHEHINVSMRNREKFGHENNYRVTKKVCGSM